MLGKTLSYTLEELFPPNCAILTSCVAPRPKQSADQNCTVTLRRVDGQSIFWPDMKDDQEPVFKELRIM